MDSGLKISAVAISAKGKGMNLDNVYVNGRYLAPGSDEPQVCIRKTSNVDFQMYGVCDGENAEDVALKTSPSAMVMQRMQQLQSVLSMDGAISRDKIWSFLCETNGKIREYQEAVGSEGVNSTFAGLFLHKNRGLAVHLGDSRIYVIRGGRMLQITEDHLEATDLYKFGIITQEQAEVHKLESRPTATLGMFDIYDVESEVFSKYFVFYPGDLFILCTDGITDSITNQEIERIVRGAKDSPKETIAQQLMQLAKEKNQDDKSIIVLQVEEVMGEGITPAATPARESAPAVQEVAAAEEESEEAPVQKKTSGLGASLAAFAAKVGGSSSQEEPQEAPVEEAPEEEEPVRPWRRYCNEHCTAEGQPHQLAVCSSPLSVFLPADGIYYQLLYDSFSQHDGRIYRMGAQQRSYRAGCKSDFFECCISQPHLFCHRRHPKTIYDCASRPKNRECGGTDHEGRFYDADSSTGRDGPCQRFRCNCRLF